MVGLPYGLVKAKPGALSACLVKAEIPYSFPHFDLAVEGLTGHGIKVDEVEWRRKGTFGRSLYSYDPSGNRLELNDPNPAF